VNSVPKEDYKRLYLRTTSNASFNWGSGTQKEEDLNENMGQIHAMGQKNTKYMRYQLKRAPLVDRTALTSTRDFPVQPLGDNICNRELAATFKGQGKVGSTPSVVKSESSYQGTFVEPTRQQMKGAKIKSFAPSQSRTQTLGGTGQFMVGCSNSHASHVAPHRGMALAGEAIIPKPNLTLCSEPVGAYNSMYKEDYIGPMAFKDRMLRTGSAPVLREQDLLAGMSFPPSNDALFATRRACYLSPGQ
jgi:hypothetical protein